MLGVIIIVCLAHPTAPYRFALLHNKHYSHFQTCNIVYMVWKESQDMRWMCFNHLLHLRLYMVTCDGSNYDKLTLELFCPEKNINMPQHIQTCVKSILSFCGWNSSKWLCGFNRNKRTWSTKSLISSRWKSVAFNAV